MERPYSPVCIFLIELFSELTGYFDHPTPSTVVVLQLRCFIMYHNQYIRSGHLSVSMHLG